MGYLVGLRAESPGFKIVHVEPTIISGLEWAAGSFESPYGTVANRWQRKEGRITMRLVIPPNSSARVVLPPAATDIAFRGGRISVPPAGGRPEVLVKSGTHEFSWAE